MKQELSFPATDFCAVITKWKKILQIQTSIQTASYLYIEKTEIWTMAFCVISFPQFLEIMNSSSTLLSISSADVRLS